MMYESMCDVCGHTFEWMGKMTSPSPTCPQCAGETHRLVSKPTVIFKGGGWGSKVDYSAAHQAEAEDYE